MSDILANPFCRTMQQSALIGQWVLHGFHPIELTIDNTRRRFKYRRERKSEGIQMKLHFLFSSSLVGDHLKSFTPHKGGGRRGGTKAHGHCVGVGMTRVRGKHDIDNMPFIRSILEVV